VKAAGTDAVLPQRIPLSPRFFGVFPNSTHTPPHTLWSTGHLQAPSLQYPREKHCAPQAPQFSPLNWRFTHLAPQGCSPSGHAQTPPSQVPPVGQELPHAPQWSSVDSRSTQSSPHGVSPDGHVISSSPSPSPSELSGSTSDVATPESEIPSEPQLKTETPTNIKNRIPVILARSGCWSSIPRSSSMGGSGLGGSNPAERHHAELSRRKVFSQQKSLEKYQQWRRKRKTARAIPLPSPRCDIWVWSLVISVHLRVLIQAGRQPRPPRSEGVLRCSVRDY
jgi:hypothetical protein